jgi:hypothetical protein
VGYDLHFSEDLKRGAAVGDPLLIEASLRLGESAADGAAADAARPVPVGPMELVWMGVTSAGGFAAGHVTTDQSAGADKAGVGEFGCQFPEAVLEGLELA